MPTYAIGDVQGCFDELQELLAAIDFDPARDHLWLVGDLVNRGPRSLDTLRFVRALGECAVCVLGNHDLHLLAAASGSRTPRRGDTFADVLGAPDRQALLDWLRQRPLMHRDDDLDFVMVHAGLPPAWTVDEAMGYAAELEAVLRADDYRQFLACMYGNQPDLWSTFLTGADRLRYIVNAFTRTRLCDRKGRLILEDDVTPGEALAWFAHPARRSRGERIVFGHWSTLQLDVPMDPAHDVFHLDHGCVWGRKLSALRLEDRAWFAVPCRRHREPD